MTQLLKTLAGSPASSISLDDVQSDPGDPLHDDEILQELFYKQVLVHHCHLGWVGLIQEGRWVSHLAIVKDVYMV